MSEFRGTGPLPGDDVSFESITTQLAETGFAVIPLFFSAEFAALVLEEAREHWDRGAFREATVGRGSERRRLAEVRTDSIHWLDPLALTPALSLYLARMELLRHCLNRELFLGLFALEAHLARFAPGGYYRAHLDRHQATSARILSSITYLDADWSEEDGGALRLYSDRSLGSDGPFLDIFPDAGKTVLFLSGEFWHEVRVARRPRHSVTGWFRHREEPVPAVFG